MYEQTVKVINRAGVHARPAAIIVQAAKDFKADIFMERDDDRVNGKSIMGVITLGAAYGAEIKVIADGPDEEAAVKTIARLFETKFEED